MKFEVNKYYLNSLSLPKKLVSRVNIFRLEWFGIISVMEKTIWVGEYFSESERECHTVLEKSVKKTSMPKFA